MKKLNHLQLNKRLLKMLKKGRDHKSAVEMAVGGNFEEFGPLQIALLKQCGMKSTDYLADIGCGSGRLAIPLSANHEGPYFGTDIMEELLDHAKRNVARPGWRFERSDGFTIPLEDGVADFACFFSVFTHILHENTYVYLEEAKRILKPGGKIVFSFLEFREDGHWSVFEDTVENVSREVPLNIFLSRDAIAKFADKLGLRLDVVRAGSDPFIDTDSGPAAFGQSVAVLAKP